MGQNNPLDRAIGITSKVTDSMVTEWTDEKHRLYLNSMEASFVKQLYSSEHGSNDLRSWLSRTQIHTKLSRLDPKIQPIRQFKVLRRGCQEKLKFERAKDQAENDNESDKLSGNHWIQHFRSHSTAKEPHLTSAVLVNSNNLVVQSVHVINRKHEREATSSKQTSPFCYRKVHKVSSITEVSDQNFVDIEVERGDEVTRRCRKKRARNAVSQITDQVVPFVVPASDEKSAFLNENNEDPSNNKNLKKIKNSLMIEPQSSPCNDQLATDPK